MTKLDLKVYINERLKAISDNTIATAEETLGILTKIVRGEHTEQVKAVESNRGIPTPRAPYNGIQQSLHIFSRAIFKQQRTGYSVEVCFLLSSPLSFHWESTHIGIALRENPFFKIFI